VAVDRRLTVIEDTQVAILGVLTALPNQLAAMFNVVQPPVPPHPPQGQQGGQVAHPPPVPPPAPVVVQQVSPSSKHLCINYS
jgi:hypothetical protein